MLGVAGLAGSVRNASACEATWNPEITLSSDAAEAALGAVTTFATRWVGLSTQMPRTAASLVPKPTVTCPSTKLMLVAVTSTLDATPPGRVRGTASIRGWADAGYAKVGGGSGSVEPYARAAASKVVELCQSLL